MSSTKDANGRRLARDVGREPDGLWGVNVWAGRAYVTDVRRYVYRTRAEARKADISDGEAQGVVRIISL